MALAIAQQKVAPAGVPDVIFIKVVPTGSYTTGGDTLNLTPNTWTDPNGIGLFYPMQPPSIPPLVSSIVGMTGIGLGMIAQVVPGTTLATYKLQMFPSGGNQGVELSAGAYAAGILAGYFIIQVFI